MRVAPSSSRPTKRPSGAGSPGPWQPLRRSRTCINRPMASAPSCSRTPVRWSGSWVSSRCWVRFATRGLAARRPVHTRARALLGALARESRERLRDGSGDGALPGALQRAQTQAAPRNDRAQQHRVAGRDATPRHANAHESASRAGLAAGRGSPRLRACPSLAATAYAAAAYPSRTSRPSLPLETSSRARAQASASSS